MPVKRNQFIKHLESNNVFFHRHGSKHDIYRTQIQEKKLLFPVILHQIYSFVNLSVSSLKFQDCKSSLLQCCCTSSKLSATEAQAEMSKKIKPSTHTHVIGDNTQRRLNTCSVHTYYKSLINKQQKEQSIPNFKHYAVYRSFLNFSPIHIERYFLW